MEKRSIYIAGPMRGLPEYNYPAFNAAAAKLRADGWTVENPVELGAYLGTPDEINADEKRLNLLMAYERSIVGLCDAIYLLRGWENSEGARLELRTALNLNLQVMLEQNP